MDLQQLDVEELEYRNEMSASYAEGPCFSSQAEYEAYLKGLGTLQY